MATAAVTNQFTASTTIVSDDVDTNFADLVTFLNGSVLHLDGAKAMTGDLDMGGQDINNVPWKTWAPSYTNFTVGNAVLAYAEYIQIGDLVIARFKITLGSSSVMGTGMTVSLPVTRTGGLVDPVGSVLMLEGGGLSYLGVVALPSTTTFNFAAMAANGTYVTATTPSATVPFTWGDTDIVKAELTYEAA